MFGSGVFRGLGVTLKQFVATYLDDIKKIPSRYAGGKETIDQTAVGEQEGLFTIQYPEERRLLPERFRYIPMLIYETNPETGAKEDRCTACGICAKVCPPQCIWIVRDKDENGKPITRPAEFYIDSSICMNCGLCAEFCPFDAIKMNHDFEISAYRRMPHLVFDLEELSVPVSYYARIRPTDYAEEEAAKRAKEAEKAARPVVERPAKTAPAAAAPAPTPTPPPAAASAPAAPATPTKRTPEEIERMKAEAGARRAAKAVEGTEGAPAPAVPTVPAPGEAAAAPTPPATPAGPTAEGGPGAGAKRSPEEIERLKAEAAARRAAKTAGEAPAAPVADAPAPAAPVEPPSATAPSGPGVGAKRSPEEIERLKAEAAARRAAKAAQGGGEEQK